MKTDESKVDEIKVLEPYPKNTENQSQSSLESSLQTQDIHLLLLWTNFLSYQIMQLLATNYKVRPKKIYSSAHGSMVKFGHMLSCHVSNDYRACSFRHQSIQNMIFLSIQN